MTIDELGEKMKSGNLMPAECAEYVVSLTGWYATYSGRKEILEGLSVDFFNKKRQDYKSDKACERAWDFTTEGRELVSLNLKLKKIEKMISAFKTLLRLKESEAKNLF